MKKTKFKQRIVNAADAFFAVENCVENKLVNFENENYLWRETKYGDFAHRSSSLETVLKQTLLFFPGTFVLYILSFSFTAMFINTFTKHSRMFLRYEFIVFTGIFLATILMTWLGLGDVRKPKHLVIPVSIISVGIIFGAIIGILLNALPYTRSIFDDLLFCAFPLALIAPFLAKGWVDKDY